MMQQSENESALNMDKIKSVVAPAFIFRTVFIAAISTLVSVAALVRGDAVAALVLLPVAGCVVWCYFDSWYALREDCLYIHFGPFRRCVKYADVCTVCVPFTYSNLTLMGLSHDCIEIKTVRGLSRTVCISPEKQYRVFDALCARCPALED